MIIGNVKTENNVFLAPMAGITDKVFRSICRDMGCGLVCSEMVSAKGLFHNSKNTGKLLETDKNERPVSVQMFGSDPHIMADMAEKLNAFENIDILDINMGCPAPKIVKNGEGSALMLNIPLAGEIIKAVVDASNKPVTVKFRKGFDNNNLTAMELALIAEKNGAAAITVHGRTREQYYSGKADWDIIRDIKKAVSLPVIGNGDIFLPQDAKNMLEYTGCNGVMIARGAQGNPWIFKRTVHYLETGELLPEPTYEQRLDMAAKHLEMLVSYKGKVTGVREMRKHLGWYIKGLPHSSEMRMIINTTSGYVPMKNVIENMKNKL